MQKQNAKTQFHKNIAKFIELSFWGFIIALLISGIAFYNSYCHKNYGRYQIFMQDVNGIIVGSPVRMLGINVGYVKHIKLINDMVYVDFIINKKGIEIPKGSKITIESSGLGGSKSLEIYTPTQKYDINQPAIDIQQPVRLGASVRLLYQMFKKIGDIIYRCTYFSKEVDFNSVQIKNENNSSNKQFLNEANKWLDRQLERQNIKE